MLCWDCCLLDMVGKQFKEFPSDINRQGQIQALLRARSNTSGTGSDWLHRESAPFSPSPKSWTPPNSVTFPRVMWECENRVRPCVFEIPKQICALLWQVKTSKGWSPFPQCKSRIKWNYVYFLTSEIHSGGTKSAIAIFVFLKTISSAHILSQHSLGQFSAKQHGIFTAQT